MNFRSAVYVGTVFHRRVKPRVHVLRYTVFTLLLDLDEIDALSERLWLFSRNRWNLLSFHDRDFGLRDNEPLVDFVRRSLHEAGIDQAPARIRLSCYPRILGYAFNPLSLFYCEDDQGQLFAVIHEVHNTFGERHAYVIDATPEPDASGNQWVHQRVDKSLFVSPFAHMDMHYRFRLNRPATRQVVVIRAFDDEGVVITASYTAHYRAMRASLLFGQFCRLPLMTVKVIVGIHYEALRLWLKRVPWFSHIPKSSRVAH